MENERKLQPYERQAYYYETDKMGIVHHSNYIRWFEEARIDMLDQMGFSFEKMEALGIMSPVLSVEAEYKQTVRFRETVLIDVSQTVFNGIRVTFSYRIVGKESGELKVLGHSSHCFVDGNFKPISLKRSYPKMYELYAQFTEPE